MGDKIKIVYIISHIDKAIAFEWIADRLNKTKFDLSFILLNNEPSFLAKYLAEQDITVDELKYSGKKDIPKACWKVLKLLRNKKPDVIHTHLVDADLIGLSMGRLLGIKKRIYTRHNSNYHKKYLKGAQKFDRLANTNCTHVASISENVSDILIKEEGVNSDKVRLVYHGFDLERFSSVQQNEIDLLTNKYNPLSRRPVIGVISRYMHWKGIQHIIPAFKKVLEIYPQAYLLLANAKKGDYKKEIDSMLKELPRGSYGEIEFEKNLFALYQLFDVFVHVPIDREVEAFGQIYVEALAGGIPSVVTLSGIAREFIKHNHNGYVVDFKNETDIYSGITKVLSNPDYTKKITHNGKASVTEKFSLDRMINTLEKLYLEE